VNRSFLPDIIRLTKERGIRLIAVRLKTQRIGSGNSETLGIRQYIVDLSHYLDEQGVIFIDYGQDPRIGSEYFTDSIHLNEKGKALFTQILANDLNEILK